MTAIVHPRRGAVAQALAGLLIASASCPSLGQAGGGDGLEVPGEGQGAALTVVVTGAGMPVAEAEVKITFPPGAGGEAILPTDRTGQALFSSSGTGAATVRVVATGWMTVLREVVLTQGPQQLTIRLDALRNDK